VASAERAVYTLKSGAQKEGRSNMYKLFVLLSVLLTATAPAFAQNKPIALKYRLEIVESGSLFEKTLKEMGTQEAASIITASCAAFGVDCSDAATVITASISMALNDQVGGEEHHGIIRSPAGYTICKKKSI